MTTRKVIQLLTGCGNNFTYKIEGRTILVQDKETGNRYVLKANGVK